MVAYEIPLQVLVIGPGRSGPAAVRPARVKALAGQRVSPASACAIFDRFANRGDRFAALVREEVAPCP